MIALSTRRNAIRGALGGFDPTEEQEAIITSPVQHGVISAGAGSGKTAVMTARVVHLIASGSVRPTEILGLTFTNKAAEELQDRVERAMETLGLPHGEAPTIQTYHGFASQLIEDHGLRGGVEKGATLLNAGQAFQLLWEVMGSMTFEHLELRNAYPVNQARGLFEDLANHQVSPRELAENEAHMVDVLRSGRLNVNELKYLAATQKRIELAAVARRFEELKRLRGVLDFGDQITLATRLAADPEVQRAFRERYHVVLLDEYQDTNIAQGRLIEALVTGLDGPAVTAVGDPAQNIYAWRGASLRNILRFHSDFRVGDVDAQQFDLRTNFRCAKSIIGVANEILPKATEPGQHPRLLVPRDGAPEGVVEAALLPDQVSEAAFIAAAVLAEIQAGTELQEIAILVRKRRLVPSIQEALLQAGIEVEVADLGGLLLTPEVVEMLSYLRAVEDPAANIAIARILSGPRWRIGYRDMALLARATLEQNRTLRDEGKEGEQVPFALGVSLERLESIEGISDEARARLESFRELFRELQSMAVGPVELLEHVITRSGLWAELAASSQPRARSARRNLTNLVERAASFRGVDGATDLTAFLAWLDAIDQSAEGLAVAQPSEEASVKILTIHTAKGLEFEVVVLPGLAGAQRSKIFPDTGRQPNPLANPQYLPFELRGDADSMPIYDGNMNGFKRAVDERAAREEARLLYVAVTRAKRKLLATAAHWYFPSEFLESLKSPLGPSSFFKLIAESAETTVLEKSSCPARNPLIEWRGEAAAHWPPEARRSVPHLPDGVAAAVRQARVDTVEDQTLIPLPPRSETAKVPTTLSVTSVVTHATCPLRFYWTVVRPLPRRPSGAARIGTIVHDWIAERHEPQLRLLDPQEYEPTPTSGKVLELRQRFAETRFATREPYLVEHPFAVVVDGRIIQGRIDAIFRDEDGSVEIVDWKTGRAPSATGPEAWQMELYALAIQRIMGISHEQMRTTFVYLGASPIVERSVPVRPADEIEADLRQRLGQIAAGEKPATPSSACRHCDFVSFCDDGGAYLDESAKNAQNT